MAAITELFMDVPPVSVSITYDDTTFRLSSVTVTNSGATARTVALYQGDALIRSQVFAPGTTTMNVPGNRSIGHLFNYRIV